MVAFLSGVLVGRGVRSQKDTTVVADASAWPSRRRQTAGRGGGAAAAQAPAAPPITAIAPPTPADEDLSYNSRLEGKQPPEETLKPQSRTGCRRAGEGRGAEGRREPRPPSRRPRRRGAAARRNRTPRSQGGGSARGRARGSGYYLKVVAYRDRRQADAVARRLGGKGYSAYVVPGSGRGRATACGSASTRRGRRPTRSGAASRKKSSSSH